jgi:hypothetical protein
VPYAHSHAADEDETPGCISQSDGNCRYLHRLSQSGECEGKDCTSEVSRLPQERSSLEMHASAARECNCDQKSFSQLGASAMS